MEELLKKFIDTSFAFDKAKQELIKAMKAEGKDKLEVSEGGYVRFWQAQVNDNLAWFQKPKEDKQETSE